MSVNFDKMQALGNDFVIIDSLSVDNEIFTADFFRNISDRTYGVGCDLVVVYKKNDDSNISARFYNQDGSEAEICGNAARCLGLLMHKRFHITNFTLETTTKSYYVTIDDKIKVQMGKPDYRSETIGLLGSIDNLKEIYYPNMFCVSVGNPHLIIFPNETLSNVMLNKIGNELSNNQIFSNRINVSFAFPVDGSRIKLFVYERGVGITKACGSGACATAHVAFRNNILSSRDIIVEQVGGELNINIDYDDNITQIGTASYVFRGVI